MTTRTLLLIALLPLALLSGPTASASIVEQLEQADVVVGPTAKVTDAERSSLLAAARRLQDSKPTKFLIRGVRPSTGRATATTLRDELTSRIGFAGTVIVLWQRPTRGVGIAGPFRQSDGQDAFENARAALGLDPIAGLIELANALPASDEGVPTDQGIPDGLPFVDGPPAGDGVPAWFVLALIGMAGAVGVRAVRAASTRATRPLTAEPETARLDPLFDGLVALLADLEIDMAVAHDRERARADHEAAVTAYGDARDALSLVRTETDCDRIAIRLVAGLAAAKRARALLDGRPPPADDAPLLDGLCSFDPKHGAATTQAPIRGPRGGSASIAVCERCAVALVGDTAPAVRTVEVQGDVLPYWAAVRTRWAPGRHHDGWLIPAASGLLLGGASAQPLADDTRWPSPAPADPNRTFAHDAGIGAAAGGEVGEQTGMGGSDISAGGGSDSIGGAAGGDF